MKISVEKAKELFKEFLITRMNSEQETTNQMIKDNHTYWIIEFYERLVEEAKKEE